jgi:uncharacterized membrane protein
MQFLDNATIVICILMVGQLTAGAITAVHCVSHDDVKSKAAWVLVILGTFHIGWIAYWFNRQKPAYSQPEVNVNYTPPPQTANGVAMAIAAELERERQKRR